jgi:hypothetical protein
MELNTHKAFTLHQLLRMELGASPLTQRAGARSGIEICRDSIGRMLLLHAA